VLSTKMVRRAEGGGGRWLSLCSAAFVRKMHGDNGLSRRQGEETSQGTYKKTSGRLLAEKDLEDRLSFAMKRGRGKNGRAYNLKRFR